MPSPAEPLEAPRPETAGAPGSEPAGVGALLRGRPAAFLRALAVVAAILILDRLTKRAVVSGIAVGDVHKFLPGVNLVHVRNDGIAFGFFAGGGALVLVLTLVALTALLVYFALRPARPWLWLPVGLLVGGALGNLIDRLANGFVTDFIKLPLWPAFNVADMAITFGVLALLYVLEGRRGEP
jgi:signal peptidase II